MPKFKNLKGKTFGRLTVVGEHYKKSGVVMWPCLCECGNEKDVSSRDLGRSSKPTRSCGCLKVESNSMRVGKLSSSYRHGHAAGGKRSRAHRAYTCMMQRCYNPNNKDFKYYGGRGIKVCKRWSSSFENFLYDMGNPPEGMSIDRIDTYKGYSPENCRWATHIQQVRNARSNIKVIFNGKEMCLSELAEMLDINYFSLHSRLTRQGMTLDEAVSRGLNKKGVRR